MAVAQRAGVVRELVPLFAVTNIEQSVTFYLDRLGFTVAQTWEPEGKLTWCRLERDGSAVMLQQRTESAATGRGRGVEFYFNCDDVDAVYAGLSAVGLTLAPPKVAFYGMKQMLVRDPDGYELWFQSQAQPD